MEHGTLRQGDIRLDTNIIWVNDRYGVSDPGMVYDKHEDMNIILEALFEHNPGSII
jgi:hypothetical protein